MPFKRSDIKNILVVSLSNIGDVVLTFPVIDILRRDFPHAKLSVIVGPKAVSLFEGDPHLSEVIIFNKRSSIKEKVSWISELKKKQFDLVIDLRNTAIPFLIGAKHATPLKWNKPIKQHMKTKHLDRLRSVFPFDGENAPRNALYISEQVKKYVDQLFNDKLANQERFIVVGPGAANHLKRWNIEGFAALCDELIKAHQIKIVFVGDRSDCPVVESILQKMQNPAINFCGQTTLLQLAEILRRSFLTFVNDSAIMHLASYLDTPIVAFFGPTDPQKYGPWSSRSVVIRKELFCSPCEKSGCAYHHECMEHIKPNEVFEKIKISPAGVTFASYG